MFIFALISLSFSGWMAWTLYSSLRKQGASGWLDYLKTVWVAVGSMSGVVVAIRAVL